MHYRFNVMFTTGKSIPQNSHGEDLREKQVLLLCFILTTRNAWQSLVCSPLNIAVSPLANSSEAKNAY